MKAAVYHGPGDVRIEGVREPRVLADDQVLIDVSHASICGTDLGEFVHGPTMIPLHHRHPASRHVGPVILGHEFTGRVVAGGDQVTGVAADDRVVPGAGNWCGTCDRCREGRPNLCQSYFVYGLHAPGGLAEHVVVPAKMCHLVPVACSDEAAALAQPLAIALHALARSGARRGESIAIVGAGGIGAFLLTAASTLAPEPLIAIDLDPKRLQRAERLGAAVTVLPGHDDVAEAVRGHVSFGVDVVIEASGTPGGLGVAVEAVRHGGRIHVVGLPAQPSTIDLHHCVVHEIDMSSSNGHICGTDIPWALELLADDGLAPIVTDRVIALERLVRDGLQPMANGDAHGKVVVSIN